MLGLWPLERVVCRLLHLGHVRIILGLSQILFDNIIIEGYDAL